MIIQSTLLTGGFRKVKKNILNSIKIEKRKRKFERKLNLLNSNSTKILSPYAGMKYYL